MGDVHTWWSLWKAYMFNTEVEVGGRRFANVLAMLEIIPRAKYPALSEEEELSSIPLQAFCLALFDAVLTHLLSRVAPHTWQPVRRALHKALFEDKVASSIAILRARYAHADVIFIQEAAEDFAARAAQGLPDHFLLRSAGADGRRPQLSLILVHRAVFAIASAVDVTARVVAKLPPRSVAPGDLCAFLLRPRGRGPPHLLASFHGDSDGHCTAPALAALCAAARELAPGHVLLVGLDANAPAEQPHPAAPQPLATSAAPSFAAVLTDLGLSSCWDGACDRAGLWTSFRARTALQPQLHKAVPPAAARGRRHLRLRDWIVFAGARLAVRDVARDNTGRGELLDPSDPPAPAAAAAGGLHMAAPCASAPSTPTGADSAATAASAAASAAAAAFPSDHAIVFATLRYRAPDETARSASC